MKVVINRCHGGFGMSDEACQWLIDNKGWTVTVYENGNYKNPDADLVRADTAGYNFSEKYHLVSDEDEQSLRSDKDLIEAIETLGNKKASAPLALLDIVEIPDDVGDNWEIGEYDGAEWVQEIHRRWG